MAAVSADLHHLQCRAPEFLLACPQGRLASAALALDYFCLSPFFDKASSNAQLRMQMAFSRGGMDGVDEHAELARFTGIEFVVAHSHPPDLFIIHKRRRSSPSETALLAAYHILNANVYLAPSLAHVLNERLLTSVHALATSFRALADLKPAWSPERQPYAWDIKPPPAAPLGLTAAGAGVASEAEEEAADSALEVVTSEGAPNAGEGPLEAPSALPSDPSSKPEVDAAAAAAAAEVDRPADAFNPLLVRALQRVALRTEQDHHHQHLAASAPSTTTTAPIAPSKRAGSTASTPGPGTGAGAAPSKSQKQGGTGTGTGTPAPERA